LAHLDQLLEDGTLDGAVGAPSGLPGWSVGHVLAHIARNADSFVHLTEAADRGEVADQYPGGVEQRNGDIEAGSRRSARELVRDVRTSIYALEQCWATVGGAAWQGEGRAFAGMRPIRDLPFIRWREVNVHHADLGLGYTMAEWPAEYVRLELIRAEMLWAARRPMGLTSLPAQALAAEPRARLAWLLGRGVIDGLEPAGIL
jgi:maleylpyruvate isomerase